MNIKLLIIFTFVYLYGFFEIIMSVKQRRKSTILKSDDKKSIWILSICIAIGYVFSFSIGATKLGRIYYWDTMFLIGIIMIIIGLTLRILAIHTLQKQFTFTVAKIENHELIQSGLYKKIRHPGYLGQLIIFLGISTSLSNVLSIVCMMIPVLVGYSYRIRIEETFMEKQLGQNYIDYQKTTTRLIPKIY